MGLIALGRIFHGSWWQSVFRQTILFRKHTLKPAILIGVAELLQVINLFVLGSLTMNKTFHGNGEVLQVVFFAGSTLIVSGIALLVIISWSLAIWVVVLTAFSRSLLMTGTDELKDSEVLSIQQYCISVIMKRKSFLVSTWVLVTLALIPAFIWISITIFVLTLSSSAALVPIQLPQELKVFFGSSLAVVSLVMCNLCLVVIPITAACQTTPRQAAVKALIAFLKTFPALTCCSLLSMAFELQYCIPNVIQYNNKAILTNGFLYIAFGLCAAIWKGGTTLLLWPLSAAFVTEVFRGKEKPENDDSDSEKHAIEAKKNPPGETEPG